MKRRKTKPQCIISAALLTAFFIIVGMSCASTGAQTGDAGAASAQKKVVYNGEADEKILEETVWTYSDNTWTGDRKPLEVRFLPDGGLSGMDSFGETSGLKQYGAQVLDAFRQSFSASAIKPSWERIGTDFKFVTDNGNSYGEGKYDPETKTITGTSVFSNGAERQFTMTFVGILPGNRDDYGINTDFMVTVKDGEKINPRSLVVQNALGSGRMIHQAEITSYGRNSKKVRIPRFVETNSPYQYQDDPKLYEFEVIGIGKMAFFAKGINSLEFTGNLSWIKEQAFAHNELTGVIFPETVLAIGSGAFANNQISGISFPQRLNTIAEQAFINNRLTEIVIPNGVGSIGNRAFANNQLVNVTIPGSVKSIGEESFRNNKIINIDIPDGVTSIGANAFADNPLTSISLPDSLTRLAANVFTGSNNLTKITIGPNVNFIGNELMPFNFRGTYLENSLRAGTYTFANGKWTADFR